MGGWLGGWLGGWVAVWLGGWVARGMGCLVARWWVAGWKEDEEISRNEGVKVFNTYFPKDV